MNGNKGICWSKLNHLQIGKFAEYLAVMEFSIHGFDVYTSEVDDKGIDFIVRIDENTHIDVQVKSVRSKKTGSYIFFSYDKFIPKDNLFAVVVVFEDCNPPSVYLIPSLDWLKYSNKHPLVCHSYKGKNSKPEWGINITPNYKQQLKDYEFNKVIGELQKNKEDNLCENEKCDKKTKDSLDIEFCNLIDDKRECGKWEDITRDILEEAIKKVPKCFPDCLANKIIDKIRELDYVCIAEDRFVEKTNCNNKECKVSQTDSELSVEILESLRSNNNLLIENEKLEIALKSLCVCKPKDRNLCLSGMDDIIDKWLSKVHLPFNHRTFSKNPVQCFCKHKENKVNIDVACVYTYSIKKWANELYKGFWNDSLKDLNSELKKGIKKDGPAIIIAINIIELIQQNLIKQYPEFENIAECLDEMHHIFFKFCLLHALGHHVFSNLPTVKMAETMANWFVYKLLSPIERLIFILMNSTLSEEYELFESMIILSNIEMSPWPLSLLLKRFLWFCCNNVVDIIEQKALGLNLDISDMLNQESPFSIDLESCDICIELDKFCKSQLIPMLPAWAEAFELIRFAFSDIDSFNKELPCVLKNCDYMATPTSDEWIKWLRSWYKSIILAKTC